MATALKLRSDIKKLKKGLEAKGVSTSVKEKLKSQLKKAENELESLKKTGKAPKKSSVAGTKVALTALQKLVNRKKYSVYKGAGVDLDKDAGQGALATGRRESKGLKANQHGDKGSNKGNVYYEYRPNRLDVKQPKKKQTYPKLEKGGETENERASKLLNKLKEEGKLKRYLDVRGNGKKVFDIIVPNKSEKGMYKRYESTSQSSLGTLQNEYLDENDVLNWLKKTMPKTEMALGGYMADGGMMAKGGQLGKFKVLPMKRIKVANSPDLLEPYYSLAFTVEGTISEANDKAQDFVKNNEEIVSATVTKIHPSGQPLKNKKVSYITKDEILKYASGGYMAMGGALEHGLKVGDVVKLISGNSIAIYNTKDKNSYRVNISEGKREMVSDMDFEEYASGGKVKVGDTLIASTGVKVKVVEYDPMFGGRVKIERMDEYATGKPSQWMPLSKFKMADGGMMADGAIISKTHKLG
jgi:hypothetical protein